MNTLKILIFVFDMNTLKSLVCVCEMNSMKILVSGLWYEYFENSGLHLHWLYFEIYV